MRKNPKQRYKPLGRPALNKIAVEERTVLIQQSVNDSQNRVPSCEFQLLPEIEGEVASIQNGVPFSYPIATDTRRVSFNLPDSTHEELSDDQKRKKRKAFINRHEIVREKKKARPAVIKRRKKLEKARLDQNADWLTDYQSNCRWFQANGLPMFGTGREMTTTSHKGLHNQAQKRTVSAQMSPELTFRNNSSKAPFLDQSFAAHDSTAKGSSVPAIVASLNAVANVENKSNENNLACDLSVERNAECSAAYLIGRASAKKDVTAKWMTNSASSSASHSTLSSKTHGVANSSSRGSPKEGNTFDESNLLALSSNQQDLAEQRNESTNQPDLAPINPSYFAVWLERFTNRRCFGPTPQEIARSTPKLGYTVFRPLLPAAPQSTTAQQGVRQTIAPRLESVSELTLEEEAELKRSWNSNPMKKDGVSFQTYVSISLQEREDKAKQAQVEAQLNKNKPEADYSELEYFLTEIYLILKQEKRTHFIIYDRSFDLGDCLWNRMLYNQTCKGWAFSRMELLLGIKRLKLFLPDTIECYSAESRSGTKNQYIRLLKPNLQLCELQTSLKKRWFRKADDQEKETTSNETAN